MEERRKKAPVGFIDLWSATDLTRRRMFTDKAPAWVIAAAQENAEAESQGQAGPAKEIQIPTYVEPADLLGDRKSVV